MKKSIKIFVSFVIFFVITIMYVKQVEAVTGKIIDNILQEKSKPTVLDSISYTAPTITSSHGGFYYLNNVTGVFCLDHSKGMGGGTNMAHSKEDVTDQANKIKYILGCEKPTKGYSRAYRVDLIQNYIWNKSNPLNLFPKKYCTSTSYYKKFSFDKITAANKNYNDHNFSGSNLKIAKIETPENSNITITNCNDDQYVKVGEFEMNNYTMYYNPNCSYVNKTGKHYNRYGSVTKETKRAGVLYGIVDANVIIYDANGNVKSELNHANGDFSFNYTKENDLRDKERFLWILSYAKREI